MSDLSVFMGIYLFFYTLLKALTKFDTKTENQYEFIYLLAF